MPLSSQIEHHEFPDVRQRLSLALGRHFLPGLGICYRQKPKPVTEFVQYDVYQVELGCAGYSIQSIVPAAGGETVGAPDRRVELRLNRRGSWTDVPAGDLAGQRGGKPNIRARKVWTCIDR